MDDIVVTQIPPRNGFAVYTTLLANGFPRYLLMAERIDEQDWLHDSWNLKVRMGSYIPARC